MTTSRPSTCSFMGCLMLLMLLTACYGPQRRQMLALLDEADSLNRAYAKLPSDTLLRQAADFFDRHGTPNEQLRAHYLLGCAYRDLGEAPQALQCYLDAIDRADTISCDCDFKLLARVHGQAGDLFAKETLYRNAINEYLTASRLAIIGRDTLTYIFAYGQLESCYFGIGNTDSALAVNYRTRELLCYHGYESYANSFLATSINLLLQKHDYIEARKQIDKYEYNWNQNNPDGIDDPKFKLLFYYKGLLNEGVGNQDSALSYYYRLVREGVTDNNMGLGYKGLLSVYEHQENSDSVIKYANLFTEHLEMMSETIKQSNLQNLQGLYDYTRHQHIAEREVRKSDKLKFDLMLALAFLIVSILIGIITYLANRHHHKQQQQLLINKNAIALIEYATIKSTLEIVKKDNDIYKGRYEALKADFEKAKNILAELQPDKKTPDEWNIEDSLLSVPIVIKLHKMASTAMVASVSDLMELRQIAQKLMPRFITTINSSGYLPDRRDTDICIFVKLRFLPSEIGILLNISKNNLSNIRKRLLAKMFKQEGSAKDFDEIVRDIPV